MKCKALLLLAVCLLLGAEPPQDAVSTEIKKLQGTWRITSLESMGENMLTDARKEAKLIIKDNKFTFHEDKNITTGTLKVDPSKKPYMIDITYADGPEKGEIFIGIYEVEGDVYKLCFDRKGRERPTEFVTKPGTRGVLEVFKREKP